MAREYYDRGETKGTRPASRPLQDEYWRRRSEVVRQVAIHWELLRMHPGIRGAIRELEDLLQKNPTVEFRVFRPEDLAATQDAGGRTAFLR